MRTKLATIVGGLLEQSDKTRNLKKVKVAEMFGMAPSYLSMWLRGTENIKEDPRDHIVTKMENIFGVELMKYSTRLKSVTYSGSTLALRKVFENNNDSMPEVKAFLDEASADIGVTTWQELLETIRERKKKKSKK